MNHIEFSVRVIVRQQRNILVCRSKERGYYFFPGGHVEFNETLERALTREIKEELGAKIMRAVMIGVVENIYKEGTEQHHEINFVFDVNLNLKKHLSIEKHIDFEMLPYSQFSKVKVFPIELQKALGKWFKTKKFFWVSGGRNT